MGNKLSLNVVVNNNGCGGGCGGGGGGSGRPSGGYHVHYHGQDDQGNPQGAPSHTDRDQGFHFEVTIGADGTVKGTRRIMGDET
jgi:hypothetical protein